MILRYIKERLNPPHHAHSPQPSDELNYAFTPLFIALQRKIVKSNWFQSNTVRDKEIFLNSGISTIHHPYDKFPLIFTTALTRLQDLSLPQGGTAASVGEYGEQWTRRMMNASHTLIIGATDKKSPVYIMKEIEDMNKEYKPTLDEYTFRETSYSVLKDLFTGPHQSLKEGMDSVLIAAALLTTYKVPGYEKDPQQLLQDIVDQRLISQLALIISPEVTAQLGANGIIFTPPVLVVNSEGKLAIRKDILLHFKSERNGVYIDNSTGADKPLERRGCPVARIIRGNEFSGVDIAAQLLAECVTVQNSPVHKSEQLNNHSFLRRMKRMGKTK